jgi:hypothetical protein
LLFPMWSSDLTRDHRHRSGRKMLVQRSDSGDFHIRRHATWGMPDKNYLSRVADEV